MKNDSLNVYERPEAEELKVTVETNILSGQTEDPVCSSPGDEEIQI